MTYNAKDYEKRVLINSSTASMIYQFNMNNINILKEMGYTVDVACNFKIGNTISDEVIEEFKKDLHDNNIAYYKTDCPRKIWDVKHMISTYKQLRRIANNNKYDIVHTQSPIGGVICRLAFRKERKNKTYVVYTAHGFHFFKGAPKKNWILYYPIEKLLSRWTDVLITINHEDYNLASKKFHMKRLEYIPGVGVDVKRFSGHTTDKNKKRKELGIPNNAFVILSVGELSDRKNQQIVIDALIKIRDDSIYYVIAGKGELTEKFQNLIKEQGMEKQIILLGARKDVDELCEMADVFAHPSIREGLGIAPLEAMASGLPLISTYINGMKDYTVNNVTGICLTDPHDINEMINAIMRMKTDTNFREKCSENNRKIVVQFDGNETNRIMKEIYSYLSGGEI